MTELWGASPRCGKSIIMELIKENQELKRENQELKRENKYLKTNQVGEINGNKKGMRIFW